MSHGQDVIDYIDMPRKPLFSNATSGAAVVEPSVRSRRDAAAARGLAAKPASITAVARHAGVSAATVSRALNDSASVRPATKARVDAAVAVLGYRVNELARNLRTSESRLLLTLVPDVGNPFYAEVVRGIDAVARDHGYHVLLCDTGADAGRERTYFDLISTRRADGAICLDPDTVQHGLAPAAANLPWVACAEFDVDMPVPYVGIDNRLAACEAVRHLIARGHRRIALLNSDTRFLYARQRQQGYADALAEAGIRPRQDFVIATHSLAFAAGAAAASKLLALRNPPTALFAVSDTLAIGALRGVRDAGRRVPDDVAVVGFDDIPLAAEVDPPLTTVAQPMRELGAAAARLLLRRLADPAAKVPGLLLQHRLVIRKSS